MDKQELIPPQTVDKDKIPYKTGSVACEIGRPFLSNPYPRDSVEWSAWREGWLAHMNRDTLTQGH